MADFAATTSRLTRRRVAYKAYITSALERLQAHDNLTGKHLSGQEKAIRVWLGKIDEVNEQIADKCLDEELSNEGDWHRDAANEARFQAETLDSLETLFLSLKEEDTPRAATQEPASDATIEKVVSAMSNINCSPLRPQLKCPTFSGKDCSRDKFGFKNFLSQFENCVAGVQSKATKLQYLRGYLSDYALQIVQHLTICHQNFDTAIDLLKKEFLDKEFIISEIFKQIDKAKPDFDPDFISVKQFLTKTRADLCELKCAYDLDFLEEDSPGNKYLGYSVFSKLPNLLKKELIHTVGSNYPSLNQILDNFNDLIRTLVITGPKAGQPKPVKRRSDTEDKKNPSTLENFATSVQTQSRSQYCRFCSANGHSVSQCSKYNTFEARQARCAELGLCTLCTAAGHQTNDCLGNHNKLRFQCRTCRSGGHGTALCPRSRKKHTKPPLSTNACYATGVREQPFILPIASVLASKGTQHFRFNCLIDTGSQRSYFSKLVLEKLRCKDLTSSPVEFEVKTFLGSERKRLSEVLLNVGLDSNHSRPIPVLIDDDMDISFHIEDFSKIVTNLQSSNFRLAAELDKHSDAVPVHGLMGVDFIQFIRSMHLVKCMHGSAWQVPTGIIPFGNSMHFLYPDQVTPVGTPERRTENNFASVVSQYSSCPSTYVNFVMRPKRSYFDPLAEIFDESLVERNLDRMFSCESLGLTPEQELVSDCDRARIREFQSSIEYKDGSYHVKLPWHEDRINSVPSNHEVALAVLNRVVKKLRQQDLLKDYREVFEQQEKEGIIERIEVPPEEFSNYVWIPHRPVIKTELQATTKIRPVFNCSLKTKGNFSLNEAAYPGINLMGDMLKLLFLFRSNKYVMLADIRKAFLMIKLGSLEDRNRFCFFMKEGDNLTCFRYKTIIFGFNASPFILNFLIKHHADTFPDDNCTDMLKNNFYVDNLVKTSNSVDELAKLYSEANERMQKGSFDLRSWNTNSQELQRLMKHNQDFVEHNCTLEKVLGYKYSTVDDTIRISKPSIEPDVCTKRGVLAQTSQVFDPLSLCLPVTVRGKMLLRDLWSQKLGWDDTISEESQDVWSALAKDLTGLDSLQFPRCAINEDSPSELYIFCDASKRAYGFAAYSVQNNVSALIFAKAKVTPMKPKTLPTLELLAVFLTIKCLHTLLDTFSRLNINNVTIAVDAQVVLSWLLSDDIKTKDQFTKNRLKDIRHMIKELDQKFSIPIKFRYIPTLQNPADMLTRGLTLRKFQQSFHYWVSGPDWLRNNPVVWPISNLDCLSERSRDMVLSTTLHNTITDTRVQPVIPFEKFSKLTKLINATSFVFKFRNKLKHLDLDHVDCAKLHLFKVMQKQSFGREISYLVNPQNGEASDLVKSLDLFLDDSGVVRSRGRIGKSTTYDYEIVHPILLAKDHPLSRLVINDCHHRCKHLGIATTLSKLRLSGFWIPRARQAVKTVISDCPLCKRFNSLSFRYPKVTNLPKHRVNLVKPFLHTGVDYTGHVWVRNEHGVSKMYLLIFTCLNIRSVHIELVKDMSTHSFILALLRFTNIYGFPSHIYSDNARSFVAGCNLIEEVFASSEFEEHFRIYNIKHIRIPLYSAWVGSTWERLIRVIKSCLYKMIGRSRVQYFDLLTMISDVQNVINSRPLTYRCSSDSGLEILTPNCFLRPNANSGLVLKTDDRSIWESDPPSRPVIIRSIEFRDSMLTRFRELWHQDYLLSLREQCKDLHEINFSNKIKVDDVVLVKNPAKTRPYWLLGRVLELIPGDDDKVRSVKIKRGDGLTQIHSVKHLYPLELSLTHSLQSRTVPGPPDSLSDPDPCSSSSSNPTRRPKRAAALRGRKRPPNDPFLYY